MAKKTQHIRVCLVDYDVDTQMCTYATNDGEVYYVPRKDVTSKVFRVNWYASLFIEPDGTTKVRMD